MATATTPLFIPENDYTYRMLVQAPDPLTGELVPVTDGTIDVFLADSESASAPANPNFTGQASHIGVETPTGDEKPLGTWLVHLDADNTTLTDCNAAFKSKPATVKPCLVIKRDGAFRIVIVYKYKEFLAATLAT